MQLKLFPLEPRLSKSKYVSGLQCHKRLYLEIHSPELATEPDQETQALLDNGTDVGELARRLFPRGVLIEHDHGNLTRALRRTAELLADPRVPALFEATFKYDNVLVRVDILERLSKETWRILEVKASTRTKRVHLDDLAIQAYVLAGSGVHLEAAYLIHLNRDYVYNGGELDLKQLFVRHDLTAEVLSLTAQVPDRLRAMKEMLVAFSPPEIEPGRHCSSPYECPFWDYCTRGKPARWIFYLPGTKRTFDKLAEQGIHEIDAIPEGFKLSGTQKRMKDNTEWIGPALKTTLETARYPIHHLDFEAFMPAVPVYRGARPYRAIPFQWSNHIETEDGVLRHEQYLSADGRDPREELTLALLASVGREGSICVYSGYEWRTLMELAEVLPSLKRALSAVAVRLWDLLPIVRQHYYHPQFSGSFSIKSVLPALNASLGYGNLEIREGGLASLQYSRMVFSPIDGTERARIRASLLEYCKRDTLAMVEIRRALLRKASRAEQGA
jgi:predicted RecB family nuclease